MARELGSAQPGTLDGASGAGIRAASVKRHTSVVWVIVAGGVWLRARPHRETVPTRLDHGTSTRFHVSCENMAASDDEPMALYEVFQNCFNKIANKQSEKPFQTSYGPTIDNGMVSDLLILTFTPTIRIAAISLRAMYFGFCFRRTYPPDSPYFPFGTRGVPVTVGTVSTPNPVVNPTTPAGTNGTRLPNPTGDLFLSLYSLDTLICVIYYTVAVVATMSCSDRDSLVDLYLDKSIDEEIHRYPGLY
ncbi:DA protein, partial [Acromyrmex insinuator]